MRQTLLGADEGQYLVFGIEAYVKPAAVPLRHRLAEVTDPGVGRIAVRTRVARGAGEGLDDMLRGGEIGVADPQVDDVHAPGSELLLLPVEIGEEVRADPGQPLCLHRSSVSASGMRSGRSAGTSAHATVRRFQSLLA